MGTTRHGEDHTHTIEGVDGTVLLTDTPGLSEIGEGGPTREAEARDLAARADLLLFVVDHDLIRSEYEPLAALARQGKRSIVVLNKKDRLIDADRDAILAKLRERLAGVVAAGRRRGDRRRPPADPGPDRRRRRHRRRRSSRPSRPTSSALEDRIAAVLGREGDALRAGNLLLRAHLLSKEAQEQLGRERDRQAQAVIDKFQWITAGDGLRQPDPRARPDGHRRGPVPDDLRAGRPSTASRSPRRTSR